MGESKLKAELSKTYKEWKEFEEKTYGKIKRHHELKKEEREKEAKKFSDYAGLPVPLSEEMMLYLDEEYFRI